VLRNVLFNLSTKLTLEDDAKAGEKRLERLNELVRTVHPGISIHVSFNDREDYHISATYQDKELSGESRILETAATGVLQVIQIFAYLVLFRPRIMLIDEPDAHLHPDKQERLIEALEKAAVEFETQIILTTHSPHVTRAASPSAKLVWMNDGEVKTDDDDAIRRLLGWGGLDKDILFFVEDEDDKPIRTILRQWPDLSRRISVCRCFGVENLPKDKLLQGLLVDGNLNLHAIIHRDRDFMTDEEVEKWKQRYKTEGTFPWICSFGDVENYFCQSDYLAALYGISIEDAEACREAAAQKIAGAREIFFAKRKVVNRVLWPDGGSIASDVIWESRGQKNPRTVLGKSLFKALKEVIKQAGFDEKALSNFSVPYSYEIAPDLKSVIVEALD
jgi:energy-coupling factor transporter ATP-binding protein EcfA2